MLSGLLLGALVGIVMGVTGAGGGILAVPLLVFGMHLSIIEAGPVGLLAVGVSAAVGALIGLKAGTVRYRAALLIAGTGMLLAPAGVWLAHRLDTRLLAMAFAAVLAWVAYRTFMDISRRGIAPAARNLNRLCMQDEMTGRFIWTGKCAGALSIAGVIAGMLSGLLGVGGGFVMVPALQRSTNLGMRSIVATSLAVITLVSLAGVATSVATGKIALEVALPFAAGSVAGMGAGSVLTSRLPQHYPKAAFAMICLGVAAMMFYKAF
jgi:uncharacterized membrane protein YfcA